MIYIFLLAAFLILWTLLEFVLKNWLGIKKSTELKKEATTAPLTKEIGFKPVAGNNIEIKNILKTYPSGNSEIKAVDIPTLLIKEGEFLAIMGRSGSGKSTLLNLIGGLDIPNRGTIYIDGENLSELGQKQLTAIRNKKIGFVFQEYNLIPTLTALENVELPLRFAKLPAGERQQRATQMLENVGLKDRIHHFPNQLSGGEAQRVTIARALVNNPTVVLADEPTGEVDSQTASQIIGIMKKLNNQLKTTFLIVTHDPAIAGQTNRIIHLQDGQIDSDQRSFVNSEELL